MQDQKNLRPADSVPTTEVQANFDDTVPGRIMPERVNGIGKGNGHDPALGRPQKAAEGRDGQDQSQGEQDQDGALRASAGRDKSVDGDDVSFVNDAIAGDDLTEIDLSARRAAGGPPPFDAASFAAADNAQGLAGPGPQLTVIENTDGALLTKLFAASKDGQTILEGDTPRPSRRSRVIRAGLDPDPAREISSLMRLVRSLKQHQCLVLGQMQGTTPTRQMIFQDEWQALPEAARAPTGDGPVYRGPDCFTYPPCEPGVLAFDIDPKDLPSAIQQKVAHGGGHLAIMQTIDPQLRTAGYLAHPSSSAGVRDTWSRFMRPAGAHHLFLVAQDGGDIRRYVKVMFARPSSWQALFGGHPDQLGDGKDRAAPAGRSDGQQRPHLERLWFDADPGVLRRRSPGQRLELVREQAAGDEARDGARVDTHQLPGLVDAENTRYLEIVAGLAAAAKPEADQRAAGRPSSPRGSSSASQRGSHGTPRDAWPAPQC